jgi:NitT/TauT family transport system substrate-binding protein
MKTKLATLLAFALAAGLSHAQIEKRDVHIAVGGKVALYYLPLTVCERLGYFKDEGLNVKISDFAGGTRSLEAVVGGSADVVNGSYEHTINMQSKKQHFQAFVLSGAAPQITVAISSKLFPKYKSPKDLKGLKVGVSAPGSSTNRMVLHLLAKDGLKGDDVSIIGVGTSAGVIAAITSGQVDAVSNLDPAIAMLENINAVVLIADTRTAKGTEAVFGSADMPAAALYAPISFIQKNPNTVQALTNAMVRALIWLQKATPEQLVATVPPEYLLGNREAYVASYVKLKDAFSPDGTFTEAGAQNTLKYLAAFNPAIKPAEIKLGPTFDNSYAQKAMAKYKR